MAEQRSYSLDELIRLTGYDRRTIAYYVQQGLLPRIGRRGPNTRYPQKFLDRLLFIKKVRELQETGAMRAVTLAEIRDEFDTRTDLRIRDVVAGHDMPRWVEGDEPGTSEQTTRLMDPDKRAARASERQAGAGDAAQVKKLLADLERCAVAGQAKAGSRSVERWTQVPVTDNVNLSVKGIREEDLDLAAALGRAIRALGS